MKILSSSYKYSALLLSILQCSIPRLPSLLASSSAVLLSILLWSNPRFCHLSCQTLLLSPCQFCNVPIQDSAISLVKLFCCPPVKSSMFQSKILPSLLSNSFAVPLSILQYSNPRFCHLSCQTLLHCKKSHFKK